MSEQSTQQSAHTPGPWKIGSTTADSGTVFNPNYVSSADDDAICQVFEIPLHTTLAEIERSGSWDRGLANASLIASAPDLLAVLEGIAETLDKMAPCPEEILDQLLASAQSAIKRAKGGK
jgi:hypothetical protein